MSLLLAIDPGTEVSGAVIVSLLREPPKVLWSAGEINNHELLEICRWRAVNAGQETIVVDALAIEMPEGRGSVAGQSTFETCYWCGRYMEAWGSNEVTSKRIYRRLVKTELTGQQNSKDSNINQAVRDRYEPTGGGATPEVGTKAKPGPLYGVKKHAWAALALAITYQAIDKR